MYGAHDVRVETVPDPQLVEPTDALVRVTRACICGSDLWPYNSMAPSATGNRMGHEFVGIVESIGANVRTVKKGDLVVAPFAWSDGTCEFCQPAPIWAVTSPTPRRVPGPGATGSVGDYRACRSLEGLASRWDQLRDFAGLIVRDFRPWLVREGA
jgi:threonine dehydrogenase-like Zn-dependent dehydrogenase